MKKFQIQRLSKKIGKVSWQLPKAKNLGLKISDPSELRRLANLVRPY